MAKQTDKAAKQKSKVQVELRITGTLRSGAEALNVIDFHGNIDSTLSPRGSDANTNT